MRRVLILLHERRATTLMMSMFLGRPGEFAHNWRAFGEVERPVWLNTVPEKQCKFYYHGDKEMRTLEDMIQARPVVDTPEAYTWVSPVNLHPTFYSEHLPPADWRFVYLFRDPRNVITSLCKRSLLEGEPLHNMFRIQCQYFKTEIEHVLPMLSDPRFYLLEFETLIAKPLETVTAVYNHMGFQIDQTFYSNLLDEYTSKYVNTSFGDGGKGSNKRYLDWTPGWISYYNEHVTPALAGLGNDQYLEW